MLKSRGLQKGCLVFNRVPLNTILSPSLCLYAGALLPLPSEHFLLLTTHVVTLRALMI